MCRYLRQYAFKVDFPAPGLVGGVDNDVVPVNTIGAPQVVGAVDYALVGFAEVEDVAAICGRVNYCC